ncbi:MAG: hypothetical protein HY904_01085 [Deltaproteobacteria bacterium]|nr:hypothetical protein [Deltaproteobacteria bacterium]
MTARVMPSDGLVQVDAGTTMTALLDALDGASMHVGTWDERYATVGDALRAGDPVLVRHLVQVEVRSASGRLSGPVAPRAAVGPDLAVFAVGVENALGSIHLRAEVTAAHLARAFERLEDAVTWQRELVERGCTLVALEGARVHAAVPRRALAAGTEPVASARTRRRVAAWTVVGWEDVLERVRAAAPGVQVLALDTHRAALSVLVNPGQPAPPAPWPAPAPLPDAWARALRLPPLEERRA